MSETTPPPATLQVSCVQLYWARSLDHNIHRTQHFAKVAASRGSRVVLFPEANLTSYYFPYVASLSDDKVKGALESACSAAAENDIWVIVGSLRKSNDSFLNLAHVVNPEGEVVHEYAKVMLAGTEEHRYCRAGEKLSLFEIDGILCTLVICRDGRHPELYRIPAMAGAQVLFHPSCSSDEPEAIAWKRTAGRAQQPVGPTTRIFHCVANTVGQSPDGKQTSTGGSFIREPNGLPLAEAGFYHEEVITAVLDLERANRLYAIRSMKHPSFLSGYWTKMIEDVKSHKDDTPE